MKLKDEIFKKAANEYALKYGKEFEEKAGFLNSETVSVPVKSASEIVKIAEKRAVKRGKRMQIALIAACSALAVIIPFSVRTLLSKNAVITEDAAYEAFDAAAPEDLNENGSDTRGAGGAQNYKGAFGSRIINMEKKLPKGYKFVSVHEDNGVAVCEISGKPGDEITLTLSDPGTDTDNYANLNVYELDGIYAYGAAHPDYSILTYEKDGVVRTFTSKYDLPELMDLAVNIDGQP